jgi:hypothetical protein
MKRIKLKILLFVLVAAVVYVACRKEDRVTQVPLNNASAIFFNDHRPNDPIVEHIAEYMKRENKKYKFVDKMIERIGYPYWDKAVVMRKASANRGVCRFG